MDGYNLPYLIIKCINEHEVERKVWYENGQLKIHELCRDGKLNGEYKSWYKNGQLMGKEIFCNGFIDGNSRHWNEDGKLISYYWKDRALIDENFSRKRLAFLRIKRHFLSSTLPIVNKFLIANLLTLLE